MSHEDGRPECFLLSNHRRTAITVQSRLRPEQHKTRWNVSPHPNYRRTQGLYHPKSIRILRTRFREVPLRRSVVADILDIDRSEGPLACGFLNSMRCQAHNTRNDEECAAILPGDSQIGDDAGND